MNPASIWYISKYLAVPASGRGGTRGFMLMRELVRAGNHCLMITSDSNHLTNVPEFDAPTLLETIDGVDLCWIRTRKYRGAHSMGRILSWLDFEWRLLRMPKDRFRKPDAVIVSSLSLLTVLNGLLLRSRYRCRLIFEVRDIWPLTIIEEGGFSRYNPFVIALGWIERLGYRRADAVVGTMPNLSQHVHEQVANPAPVHTIPFGVDPEMIEKAIPVPAEWLEAHLPKEKFVVCHAGTVGLTNALEPLFECAREMKDNDKVHFLIVGEGALKAQYEAMCADLPNVSFTGAVPKPMVQAVISHCDLVYFSALASKVWTYGQSLNKIIDYMLSGKPTVGSYTGYPTMIEEAGSGSVVPAADPLALKAEILRYAAMPAEQLRQIGGKGRDWLLAERPYRKLAEEYLRILVPDGLGVAQDRGRHIATSDRRMERENSTA